MAFMVLNYIQVSDVIFKYVMRRWIDFLNYIHLTYVLVNVMAV